MTLKQKTRKLAAQIKYAEIVLDTLTRIDACPQERELLESAIGGMESQLGLWSRILEQS